MNGVQENPFSPIAQGGIDRAAIVQPGMHGPNVCVVSAKGHQQPEEKFTFFSRTDELVGEATWLLSGHDL